MQLRHGKMVTAELLVLCGEREGERIPLRCWPFLIGRSRDCDLRPTCPLASRYHCVLLQTDDGLMIRDLSSTHGTCVNNETIHTGRLLQDGDRIYVGMQVYELCLTAKASKSAISPQMTSPDREVQDRAPTNSDMAPYYCLRNGRIMAH